MRKVFAFGIIIFVGVLIVSIGRRYQVSTPAPSSGQYIEHWMLLPVPPPFPDGVVHVALTSEYPITDASGSSIFPPRTRKSSVFFRQSLPPPSLLD